MNIAEAGKYILSELKKCKAETAELDAQLILSHILKLEKHQLIMEDSRVITEDQLKKIKAALQRRIDGEPAAYITGKKEFYSIDFIVNKDVLIPRPETELIVDLAVYYAKKDSTVLDIGTGSGAIAVALKNTRPDLEIHACDISEKALEIAQKNAENNLEKNIILFSNSDLFEKYKNRKFDLILSNPPYLDKEIKNTLQKEIFFEPEIALFAGEKGKEIIKRIIFQGNKYLNENGIMLIEIGYDQEDFVKKYGNDNDYSVSVMKDYSGLPRVAVLRTA